MAAERSCAVVLGLHKLPLLSLTGPRGVAAASCRGWWPKQPVETGSGGSGAWLYCERLHRQLYPNNTNTDIGLIEDPVIAAFTRHAAALHTHAHDVARAGRVAVMAWHACGRNCAV